VTVSKAVHHPPNRGNSTTGSPTWARYSSTTHTVQLLKPTGIGTTSQLSNDHKYAFWAGFGV